MKLWHCPLTRSHRALWTLEEAGIDYDLEVLQFPPRVHHPEYLEINVLGTVPFFKDGDVQLTESIAICHYLVERYQIDDLCIKPKHPDYGNYINWLYHSDATLTFPLTLVNRYRFLEPDSFPGLDDEYAKWFFARLRLLKQYLEGKKFLCDNRFTIADIAVGYALYLGKLLNLSDRYSPLVREYLEHLENREAFKRAVAIS